MPEFTEDLVYDRIGEDGFARLIADFYQRVPHDPVLGPMYSTEELEGAQRRLRDFLVGRFGGPPRYIQDRGHPQLRMRHGRFAIDRSARDRWIALMQAALADADLPPEVENILGNFFRQTATFLINQE